MPLLTVPQFLMLDLLLILLALPLALALGRQVTHTRTTTVLDPGMGEADLDPITLAYLAGGAVRVAETALVRRQDRGALHKGTGLADAIERDVSLAVAAKRFHPRMWEVQEARWARRANTQVRKRSGRGRAAARGCSGRAWWRWSRKRRCRARRSWGSGSDRWRSQILLSRIGLLVGMVGHAVARTESAGSW